MLCMLFTSTIRHDKDPKLSKSKVSSIEAGKATGPITYHGSYEETCAADLWNSDAGLYVEYTDEVIHKRTGEKVSIPVYLKITRNDKQLVTPCTVAGTQ